MADTKPQRYRVIRGLDWPDNRAEPGETRDDIPAKSIPWLLRRGDIELLEDLSGLTREELDARAIEAGVKDPDKLPNKQAVIDAIEGTH